MSQVLQGPTPSPTSTQNQTTTGMLITLMTSMIVFFVIQTIFEYNRYYKQIYLKRLQKRFQVYLYFNNIFENKSLLFDNI
jgi:hypothetical protein